MTNRDLIITFNIKTNCLNLIIGNHSLEIPYFQKDSTNECFIKVIDNQKVKLKIIKHLIESIEF